MQTNTKRSWFKQFWPWFLIGLPMAAVVGSISTMVIATHNKPDMVVDDYYKTGKAINADFSLLRKAKALGISGAITQQEDGLLISLKGLPDRTSIRFSLHHSTLAKRDRTTMLSADASGNFHYIADEPLTGKWTVRIEPFDKKWRLQKKIHLPSQSISL